MELVVLSLGVLVIVAAVGLHIFDRVWARRLMVRRKVLVSLRSNQALVGVLWARRGRVLVLRGAELHDVGGAVTVMDGDVIVDRDEIEYVQAVHS